MMETNGINEFIPYDGSVQTAQEGARHRANPTFLGSCQQPYPAANAVPVPSDRMASMTESMVSYSTVHVYASLPLDHPTQPGDDYIYTNSRPFAQTNPNDPTYNHGRFEYNGSAKLDPMGQHLDDALLPNPGTHAGTKHDHYPTPMALAVSDYSFPNGILSPLSTSRNPSHDTPSSQQDRSAKTTLMAPTPIKVCMDGTLGYDHTPVFEPFENTGPHRNVVFSVPLPYPSLDPMVQELRRLRLGSQGHITLHLESANRHQFISNLQSGHNGPRCSSPDLIHEGGQGDPLSFPTLTDGHTDYPPPHHPTLDNRARSYGRHMPTRTQSERTSGHRRGLTFPPYRNPNKTIVNEIRRAQPRPQVHTTDHFPGDIVNGQAPPTSMHRASKDNVTEPSPTSSETQYNYPTQQPTIWASVGWPSSAENPTRMHREHSSGQCPNQGFSSFAHPAYQDDVAVSTPSTSSFPGWRDNGMQSPQFSPTGQLPNLPLPSRTPPAQHDMPRQETFSYNSDCSNPDEVSPCSPNTAEDGHFAALSPILADEEQNGSFPSPTTHPSNALRAQHRLQTILGRPSPLTNKALITLLLLILESPFIWMHEMESRIESEHGQNLLAQVKSIPDCPPNVFQLSRGSIYAAFVSYPEFVCLICGKAKQSMTRGIGCVRSHLDHRPFPCRRQGGCKSCPKGRIVRRFFTASLLHDHCNAKETPCTFCGAILKSSVKRHWDAQHPDIPFPCDRYPRYRKEQPSHS